MITVIIIYVAGKGEYDEIKSGNILQVIERRY